MAETPQTIKKTPRDLASLAFRCWKLFTVSALLFAAAVLIGSHWLPISYAASTSFTREVAETLSEDTYSGVRATEAFESSKTTLAYDLTGYTAVEKAVVQLGMFKDLPRDANGALSQRDASRWKDRIDALRSTLVVDWEAKGKKRDLVTLSFTWGDANIAKELPDLLVKDYIAEQTQSRRQALNDANDFLTAQTAASDKRQSELTDRKIEMETQNVGLVMGTSDDIDRRIQQAKADYDAVRRLRNVAENKYNNLLKLKEAATQPTSQPTQVIKGPNPELDRLGSELREYKVELDLAITLRHMTPSHPAIKTLLERIELMEKRIRETPAEIVLQTVYGQGSGSEAFAAQVTAAKSEMDILDMEFARVEAQVKGYEKMMENYGPVRQEYNRILDELSKATAETKSWANRLREVDAQLAAEENGQRMQLATVELAKRPDLPSFPRTGYIFGAAAGGGLLFGLTLVLLFKMIDRTVSTVEDASTYFELPVAGTIGEILSRRSRLARFLKRYLFAVPVALVLLCAVAVSGWSIYLKLNDPERYHVWSTTPVAYLHQQFASGPEGAK